jgi:hypothetical protein
VAVAVAALRDQVDTYWRRPLTGYADAVHSVEVDPVDPADDVTEENR